jgi:hypothetical protein
MSRPGKKLPQNTAETAFRLIENGNVHDEYYVGDSVDSETLTRSPHSVNGSAWACDVGEAGKIDLDTGRNLPDALDYPKVNSITVRSPFDGH